MRKILLTLVALTAALLAQAAPAATGDAANARVIVKYKADSTLGRMQALSATTTTTTAAQRAGQVEAMSRRMGLTLRAGASIAERTHVVFAQGLSSAQLAQRLAADADVEYAVPDERKRAMVAPNDPYYPAVPGTDPAAGQWYLRAPTATLKASIDVEPAWAITTGSNAVVVAVLDTGVLFNHPDLKRVANGGNLLDGYDMIADDLYAFDNISGRDNDPSDPGDWISPADANSQVYGPCDAQNSSWHGTAVAALIGALTDNGIGMASVGRNVRVLPVRVLGKCGGFDSDIIAAMRWSAGLSTGDPNLPVNPNRAKVINLSLGGVGGCSQAYRNAVNDLNVAGTVVVASTGNGTGHAVNSPANCPGVIAVSALRHVGSKVGFADIGPETTISAPGGNCINTSGICVYPILTASNSGTTTPGGNTYASEIGTSFSAPLVAGTVALMLSADPTLTPRQTQLILQGTARSFPSSGATNSNGAPVLECTAPQYDSAGNTIDQDQCYCSTGTCGAGMLDAGAAVANVVAGGIGNGVQARIDLDSRSAHAGSVLALSGTNSVTEAGGRIVSYQWTLVDGGGGVVTQINNPTSASASVTPRSPGRFAVALTVTDDVGSSSTTRLAVVAGTEVALDDSGGGGGGALGAGWLLMLLAAVAALAASPRRAG
jgi:serine protease